MAATDSAADQSRSTVAVSKSATRAGFQTTAWPDSAIALDLGDLEVHADSDFVLHRLAVERIRFEAPLLNRIDRR
jgi:hypothetical protein